MCNFAADGPSFRERISLAPGLHLPQILLGFLGIAIGIQAALSASPLEKPGAVKDPIVARRELDRRFEERLTGLADRAQQLGLVAQAEQTRAWFIPRDPRRSYLFLPRDSQLPRSPRDSGEFDASALNAPSDQEKVPSEATSSAARYWEMHFREARQEQARGLFELARQSAEASPATAYQLLHEILHEDPDHEEARQILGFRRTETGWSRPGDAVGVTRGRTPVRPYGFASRQYHQVTTANFRLLTDAEPERARQLAEKLEDLHGIWRQVFYVFWSDGATLARRMAAGSDEFRPRTEKYQVVWFRDRARYLEVLLKEEPLIEKTLGIYLDRKRVAFLYGEPEEMLSSWLHEVAHQLFAETIRTAPEVGSRAHMWIAEGIALYLESLRWFPGYCTLGGFDADRLQFARYRALAEQSHVPLAELTGMGRRTLQRDPRIGALYSQAAGFTDFLMHGQERRHRDGLMKYLKAVYMGRDDPQLLALFADTPYAELDAQYVEHLQVDDQQLVYCQPVVNLYLGRSFVTDVGLAHVPVEKLEWLDVGFTSVTDAGVARLVDARGLKKLTLEHSQVTRESLSLVQQLDQLEYLDLSGLRIGNEDLAFLSNLTQLETLWLTDTQITDEGLRHLHGLAKLRTLDVTGTGVTPSGWTELRQTLPQLED